MLNFFEVYLYINLYIHKNRFGGPAHMSLVTF